MNLSGLAKWHQPLISDNSYDGKYFKIVYGKSDEAIRFDASKEIQLKAATTYYHLNIARQFFTDVIKSDYVKDLPPLIIRLDLINVFNEVGHFANDRLSPQFNNALSIPAGAGYPPKNIHPWGNEIWFRPSKEIQLPPDIAGIVKNGFSTFRNQTHMMNLDQFISILLQGKLPGNSIRLAGTSLLTELIYQSSGMAAEFFSRKIYRLDSALVPEIIYHEFSHIALSDHLELSHSTSVNEGLADYFAGKIANSKKLATKIKNYNLFNGKEVRKNQDYRLAFEKGEYANSDFVFGLLWNIGSLVGGANESSFVYDMSTKINTNDNIRDGLIDASLDTCKDLCKDSFNDRLKLYKLYNSRRI